MKSIFTSKTIWAAVLTFAVAVTTELAAEPAVADAVKTWIGYILPVLMVALRLVTDKPVSLSGR